jgi:hypothetical protein
MMATGKQWATAEWLRLLAKLPRRLDAKQLADLANRYQPAVPVAETFLARVAAASSCSRCSRR